MKNYIYLSLSCKTCIYPLSSCLSPVMGSSGSTQIDTRATRAEALLKPSPSYSQVALFELLRSRGQPIHK
ncbi:hypothetical protein Patl1_35346 [Pistacia atlantica]|nr:hypothetical protein Patl1_35346 [Pistacia atlantica]